MPLRCARVKHRSTPAIKPQPTNASHPYGAMLDTCSTTLLLRFRSMWGTRNEQRFGFPTRTGASAMNLIKQLWSKTKEAFARLRGPAVKIIERQTVIVRVIYMWKPSLTIRRCRIDPAAAAAAGQLQLF